MKNELKRLLDKEKELAIWLDEKANQSNSKYQHILSRYTDLIHKIALLKCEIDESNKNKQKEVRMETDNTVNPANFVMPFGKYKNKTLEEIKDINNGYLLWARNNLKQIAITNMIEAFLERS